MREILFGLVVVGIIGAMFTLYETQADVSVSDALRFKQEYEELNDVLGDNGENKFLSIEINETNKIKYSTFDEVMNLLENGTGVIYFGRPDCPWSRIAVPVMMESADSLDIENVHYFNADSIRDEKHLDEEGNIITDKEGSEDYYKLLDKLSSVTKPYAGLNDETIKRLYFPTIVVVKNGKIVAHHTGTVESQKSPKQSLTDEQRKELKSIYDEAIMSVIDNICNQTI